MQNTFLPYKTSAVISPIPKKTLQTVSFSESSKVDHELFPGFQKFITHKNSAFKYCNYFFYFKNY